MQYVLKKKTQPTTQKKQKKKNKTKHWRFHYTVHYLCVHLWREHRTWTHLQTWPDTCHLLRQPGKQNDHCLFTIYLDPLWNKGLLLSSQSQQGSLSLFLFKGSQDPHTAVLKSPGTPWSTLYWVQTPSLFRNICGCYVSAAVYIKLSFNFTKRHPGQDLNSPDQDRKADDHRTDRKWDAHRPRSDVSKGPLVSLSVLKASWNPLLQILIPPFMLLMLTEYRDTLNGEPYIVIYRLFWFKSTG